MIRRVQSRKDGAMRRVVAWVVVMGLLAGLRGVAGRARAETFARYAVVSQEGNASDVGREVLGRGGNAVDAAIATAFALAVTHPTAGNIGGGGFIVFRPARGEPTTYDFREIAPARASPAMFLVDGKYDSRVHHDSHRSVGVPGTVAGLHLAWQQHGKLPWRRLVEPAVILARDGFVVSDGLARSLRGAMDRLTRHPASVAQFTRNGTPYEAGDL